VTGTIADRVCRLLGVGSTGVLVSDIAKWSVLALLISLVIATLYRASPNVRQRGSRWPTPGSVLASAGFAFSRGTSAPTTTSTARSPV
jgi:membrane protein